MTVIPRPKAVKDLFADLLGRQVEIEHAPFPVVPSAKRPCCIGVYVTDRLQTGAVVCADIQLAARSGAALGLVPPLAADVAVDDRELPESLLENFGEVINIFAGLFNRRGLPHLKLYSVHAPNTTPPDDITLLLRGLNRRGDYRLTLEGYGVGHLGVVLPWDTASLSD